MNTDKTKIKSIIITQEQSGQRIDNFLITKLKKTPKSMIYRLLRKGGIRVNKKRVQPKYKLNIQDEIRMRQIHTIDIPIKNINNSIHLNNVAWIKNMIFYEDDYLLIINKPAGIAVHGGSGIVFGIIEGLRILRPNDFFLELVHRLDKETSGALLIAKKYSVLRALHEQLRMKNIQKEYLALVHGHWNPCVNIVTFPLTKSSLFNGKHIVLTDIHGKPSETHIQIKEYFLNTTLIKAIPTTGRTHQIRVHTQRSGHPIVFDSRYGSFDLDKKLQIFGIKRLFLHANTLNFVHPINKKRINIKIPLDKSLLCCLDSLRKNNNNSAT